MNDVIIIIPTFNESKTILKIIEQIINIDSMYYILIVDDNSPDDTAKIVEEYITVNNLKSINIIKRPGKQGLGSAYIEGFKYALNKNFNKIIQMDADLSHNPNDIPRMIKLSDKYDLIIGSRYINGIRIINWPISRLFLSYFANLYARTIIGINILDLTGGYKCFNSSLLKKINLDIVKSEGYSFQIEMNYLASTSGHSIKEIPIIFTDRQEGVSKMSKNVILEAIMIVPYLKIKKIFKIKS